MMFYEDESTFNNNSRKKEQTKSTKTKEKDITNIYEFDFSEVSEEDIIKGSILSDVSVFLHGKSSDGKSARIKALDPDCTIIYMCNATPDSLNGKSVFNSNTGEMLNIMPSWYAKLKDRCDREPNKIHLVFFDELSNATPTIQGMAFNIILDKEVNGIWKLPENARIVAAGNEVSDSLSAFELSEPLFNRFAHVYISTNSENWLQWAVDCEEENNKLDYIKYEQPRKIHPAIISYIAYKSATNNDALRSEFTGKEPNADPRKWEMASKILYKTNKPAMLRALVGEEITNNFISFCKIFNSEKENIINKKCREINIDEDKVKSLYKKY